MTTLTVGGPLAIECKTCGQGQGSPCRNVRLSSPGGPTKPHAARAKAASPEQTARVGDLVLVNLRGTHLAHLVAIGESCSVRIWRAAAQTFASPRLVPRAAVFALAPEDARAKLAKEELEQEARAESGSITRPGHSPSGRDAAPMAGAIDPWSNPITPETTGRKGW